MRVVFLFRARVSAILRRLSNLNPIAEPKAERERERERERREKKEITGKKLKESNKISPSGQDNSVLQVQRARSNST